MVYFILALTEIVLGRSGIPVEECFDFQENLEVELIRHSFDMIILLLSYREKCKHCGTSIQSEVALEFDIPYVRI